MVHLMILHQLPTHGKWAPHCRNGWINLLCVASWLRERLPLSVFHGLCVPGGPVSLARSGLREEASRTFDKYMLAPPPATMLVPAPPASPPLPLPPQRPKTPQQPGELHLLGGSMSFSAQALQWPCSWRNSRVPQGLNPPESPLPSLSDLTSRHSSLGPRIPPLPSPPMPGA